MKFTLSFILILFLNSFIYAQQVIDWVYNYNDLITSQDAFYDKQSFNPSYTGDTLRFKISIKKNVNWESDNWDYLNFSGLSFEKYNKNKNFGIGLIYDFNKDLIKRHNLRLNYNYRFSVNSNLQFRIATSVGVSHYTMNVNEYNPRSAFYLPVDGWSDHPLLSVGGLINYKAHEFGIVYSEILNFDFTSTSWNDPSIFRDYLVSNYNYAFGAAKTICFTPEIISYWDFKSNYWILKASINFKKRIQTGLFYRSNNEFGFMFGGTPWKVLKLDYVCSYEGFIDDKIPTYTWQGVQISYLFQ